MFYLKFNDMYVRSVNIKYDDIQPIISFTDKKSEALHFISFRVCCALSDFVKLYFKKAVEIER